MDPKESVTNILDPLVQVQRFSSGMRTVSFVELEMRNCVPNRAGTSPIAE
jgi:hypothetical protein